MTWPAPVSLTVSVRVTLAKVAVTPCAALSVTVQPPIPLQPPPDQPAKIDPGAAVWVSVTTVPCRKLAEQTAPQSIPEGLLVTVPEPAPDFATVSAKLGITSNCAVTPVAALSVTTHWAVPLQPPPDQPAKLDPEPAVAVSVTTVPCRKLAAQTAPQLIPEGLLVTVPEPVPALATVSAKLGIGSNCAVTLCAALSVTTHWAVPLQPPPDQPENIDPRLAVAVSVTGVPL